MNKCRPIPGTIITYHFRYTSLPYTLNKYRITPDKIISK